MFLIDSIAYWYARKGKIILTKIAYVLAWINGVLSTLGAFITPIILSTEYELDAWILIVSWMFGLPLVAMLNLIFIAFLKGELFWLRSIKYTEIKNPGLYKRSAASNVTYAKHFYSSEKVVDEKPEEKLDENKTEIKGKLLGASDADKLVVFKKSFTGLDTNDDLVVISKGSVGKVISIDGSFSVDIEWIDEKGVKRIIQYIPVSYIKYQGTDK